MCDMFEGMEEQNMCSGYGETITLSGNSNVVLRCDRDGVQATYTKCEDCGPENCGKWMQANGEELVLPNVVTFLDGEVQIASLGSEDYEALYALQGGSTVYRVLFPLN